MSGRSPEASAGLSGLAASFAGAEEALGALVRRDPRARETGDRLELLLLAAPASLFETLLAADAPGIPPPGFLPLMAASGYCTGAWLRRALRASGASAGSAGPSAQGLLEAAHRRATAALDAAAREGDAVLADAEAELEGLVAQFGHALGGLLELVELPPLRARDREGFAADRGPLDPGLALTRLRPSESLRRVLRQLASPPGPRFAAVASRVAEGQAEGVAAGREAWARGLSIEGLDEVAYGLLLEIGALRAELTQAAAAAAALAAAEGDHGSARRAALCRAGLSPWLAGQQAGLVDPAVDALADEDWPWSP